ncbi:MAG: sensor diguanylate cyclase [Frankiales bacterium]|nr:sensor diguanylate cyclase [Frankiales bacterium]
MTSAPELARLARLASGDPEAALLQLLRLLCEQLGLQHAVLGRIRGDVHTIDLAVTAGVGRARALEADRPVTDSWCAHVPAAGTLVVADVEDRPDLHALPVTAALGIGCYVGTVVRGVDGRELGVLGVAGSTSRTDLDDRDLAVLEALSEVVGELYPALLRDREARLSSPQLVPAQLVPAQRTAADLVGLAGVVSGADGVEGLTRPLLDALHDLSGIASTYLTVVHAERDVQEIRYARNTKEGFALPEGLHVPWGDTLCKRALDEGRACTTDVPAVWADSGAAAALGIVTYVSVPVRLSDGRVWGTLCGADDVAHADAPDHLPTLALFARLIAGEVERTAVVAAERAAAARARKDAETDALTGCSSRRTVQPWLDAALSSCSPDQVVALTYVDVDRFKQVNDGLGHAAGDQLLAQLGERLRTASREGDLVARLGGDEFVVAARLPRVAAAGLLARVRSAGSFPLLTATGAVQVRCSVGLAVSDDALDLLAAADVAMYADKPAQA